MGVNVFLLWNQTKISWLIKGAGYSTGISVVLLLFRSLEFSNNLDLRLSPLHAKSHLEAISAMVDDFVDGLSGIFKVILAEDELVELDEFLLLMVLGSLAEVFEVFLILRENLWVSVIGNSLRHWVAILLTFLMCSQAVRGELRVRTLRKIKLEEVCRLKYKKWILN